MIPTRKPVTSGRSDLRRCVGVGAGLSSHVGLAEKNCSAARFILITAQTPRKNIIPLIIVSVLNETIIFSLYMKQTFL